MTQIAKKDSQAAATMATPADLLQMAVQQGADLDKLEKLMDLQQRWERDQARKAFVGAMAEFKKNPPRVTKNKEVAFDNVRYKHATLDHVVDAITHRLSEVGITHSWSIEQKDGLITVSCVLTHELGYSERVSMSSEPDRSGKKNSIQAIASAVSYLERYTLFAVTGTAASDMDDDARSAQPVDSISESQVLDIISLIEDSGADKAKFLRFFKISDVGLLPADRFQEACAMLEARRKKS